MDDRYENMRSHPVVGEGFKPSFAAVSGTRFIVNTSWNLNKANVIPASSAGQSLSEAEDLTAATAPVYVVCRNSPHAAATGNAIS